MKIKNLTSEVLALRVIEFGGSREYFIYLQGNSTTELEGCYLSKRNDLTKIEIEGTTPVVLQSIEVPEIENPQSEEVAIPEEEEKKPEVSDKFICDICGEEFGSARGLNSHKNRAHSDQ